MKYRILAVIFSVLLLISPSGFAQDAPTREEVIAEVARTTGLSSDILEQVLGGKPAWLNKLGTAVAAAQTIDKLLSGKDAEVVADYIANQVSNASMEFMKKVLPTRVTTFFTAVKVYKASLEFIRDYAFLPGLDARVYTEYKRARMESRVRSSDGSVVFNIKPAKAFDQAIFNTRGESRGVNFKGYWTQRETQLKILMRAKDYNPGLVGRKLEKHLEEKLDEFWTNRLEVSFQRELLAKNKKRYIDAIWASVQYILDQLVVPAKIDASLFVDPASELPDNWWWVRQGRSSWEEGPLQNTQPSGYDIWRQGFTISKAKGFRLDGESWCKPKSGTSKDCAFPYVTVRIFIMIAKPEMTDNPAETHKESLDYHVANNGYTRLSDKAIWIDSGEQINLDFLVDGYYATVQVRASSKATVSLGLAKKFGRVVAQKLKQRSQ